MNERWKAVSLLRTGILAAKVADTLADEESLPIAWCPTMEDAETVAIALNAQQDAWECLDALPTVVTLPTQQNAPSTKDGAKELNP